MVLMSVLIVLPLVGFYLWMFSDMSNNDRLGPPPFIVSPAKDFKYNWTFDFIFLNAFAAVVYFATEYQRRR
jgi:hypothetical protein